MFSTLPIPNLNFSFTFILSCANAFNLDQSEILSFGKELRQQKSFYSSSLQAFADYSLHFVEMMGLEVKNIIHI